MVSHKQRILTVLRGEMADQLPYVPRLDLWYLANWTAGRLPEQHQGRTQHEISRAEGWALHHFYADDVIGGDDSDDYLHRGIGIYRTRLGVMDFEMPADVEIRVSHEGDFTRVEARVGTFETEDHKRQAGLILEGVSKRLGTS